jgi:hypothetical protein
VLRGPTNHLSCVRAVALITWRHVRSARWRLNRVISKRQAAFVSQFASIEVIRLFYPMPAAGILRPSNAGDAEKVAMSSWRPVMLKVGAWTFFGPPIHPRGSDLRWFVQRAPAWGHTSAVMHRAGPDKLGQTRKSSRWNSSTTKGGKPLAGKLLESRCQIGGAAADRPSVTASKPSAQSVRESFCVLFPEIELPNGAVRKVCSPGGET